MVYEDTALHNLLWKYQQKLKPETDWGKNINNIIIFILLFLCVNFYSTLIWINSYKGLLQILFHEIKNIGKLKSQPDICLLLKYSK